MGSIPIAGSMRSNASTPEAFLVLACYMESNRHASGVSRGEPVRANPMSVAAGSAAIPIAGSMRPNASTPEAFLVRVCRILIREGRVRGTYNLTHSETRSFRCQSLSNGHLPLRPD